MRNKLSDLNNYLFECIERLTDDELSNEQFEREVERSETIQKIAKTIIDNGSLALQAQKHFDEYGVERTVEIPLLGGMNKQCMDTNTPKKNINSCNLLYQITPQNKLWKNTIQGLLNLLHFQG